MKFWKVLRDTLAVSLAVSAFFVASTRGIAQEKYTPEELQTFFDRVAKQYEFEPKSFKLIEQPLLHWANPVRRQEQGGLYVWTEDGRPAAMASIFSFEVGGGRVMYRHEIFSTTEYAMTAKLNGRVVWEPKANVDLWTDMEGVPAPASVPARRLSQLRGIARQFRGEKTELDGGQVKLKLMPQPLFRYSSEKQSVIDGAVFGIVEATDPEIYLFVEAYTGEGQKPKWRYAAFQSHWLDMKLIKGDQVVWTNELNRDLMSTREGQKPYSEEPYFTFYSNDPLPPAASLRSEN